MTVLLALLSFVVMVAALIVGVSEGWRFLGGGNRQHLWGFSACFALVVVTFLTGNALLGLT